MVPRELLAGSPGIEVVEERLVFPIEMQSHMRQFMGQRKPEIVQPVISQRQRDKRP